MRLARQSRLRPAQRPKPEQCNLNPLYRQFRANDRPGNRGSWFIPVPQTSPGRSAFPSMKEALGQQLRQAREEHQLSLEQVSKATLMRVHYLKAMEAGDFEALPSLAQARGFLRTYANYLGLDAEALLGNLEGNEGIISTPAAAQASTPGGNGNRPSGAGTKYPSETQHIFEEIGQKLQQQHQRLGLSLEDVEKYTHLRVRYMQALESGSLDDLPSPVQGRGMLKNYAIFLGMDPEPLLLSFAEGLQVRLAVAQQATRPAPRTAPVRRAKSLRPAPAHLLQRVCNGGAVGACPGGFRNLGGGAHLCPHAHSRLPNPLPRRSLRSCSPPRQPAQLPRRSRIRLPPSWRSSGLPRKQALPYPPLCCCSHPMSKVFRFM